MGSIKKMLFAFGFIAIAGITNVAAAQPASAACVDNTYRYSLTVKSCVKYIQRFSNTVYARLGGQLGGNRQLVVDGQYGSKTVSAIKNLQSYTTVGPIGTQSIVPLTVDGATGHQTWVVLCLTSFSNIDYSVLKEAGCWSADNRFFSNRYDSVGYLLTPHN